jgi:large subunit ribosomal protein L33
MATKTTREYITLECKECKSRNYRTSKQLKPRGAQKQVEKLALNKFCKKCHKHVTHNERKK